MSRVTSMRQQTTARAPARLPLLARLNTRGFRLLMVADAVAVLAALVLPMLVRHGLDWPAPPGNYWLAYPVITAVHLGAYYFGGLYEREQRLGNRPMVPWVASMTFGAFLLVALVHLLTGDYYVPRGHFAPFLVLSVLAVAGNRRISRALRIKHQGPPRLLMVGVPDDLELARSHLDDSGVAHVVAEAAGTRDLFEQVRAARATDVLLMSGDLVRGVYPEPLLALDRSGVGVYQRVSGQETLLGLENLREIAGMPLVALRTGVLPRSRARLKRLLELMGLLAVGPLALAAFVLIALYVRVVAGGPVLFRQARTGKDGQLFRMVKFRTMRTDADRNSPAWEGRRDPRIAPGCWWLRASRLDELPQLWNVLRGEMSLVGPRPELPDITSRFTELLPGYARRHEIPPGITGLAQIKARYHTDPEYKLGHDLHYLVNWSPVLDLQILLRTVWVVLSRRG